MRLVLAVALLALAREPGCGGVDSTENGPGAPCTRDKDCTTGSCVHGVCAGADAGAPDDGGGDASDGGHD